jgi:hypothetical protein
MLLQLGVHPSRDADLRTPDKSNCVPTSRCAPTAGDEHGYVVEEETGMAGKIRSPTLELLVGLAVLADGESGLRSGDVRGRPRSASLTGRPRLSTLCCRMLISPRSRWHSPRAHQPLHLRRRGGHRRLRAQGATSEARPPSSPACSGLQHKGSDLDDLTAHPSSTAIVATKPS